METVVFSVFLEAIVSGLIDNLRKSSTCKDECRKLEVVVGKNKPKLERLARGLDRSKRNGQDWVALEEWCVDMKDLLVSANEFVHECQSGSRPYNRLFSASLATRIEEIRTSIENKLSHATTLESFLEHSAYCANGMQQCHCTAALQHGHFLATQHGHCMVQTTFQVASLQYSASMPHLHTVHPSPGWNQQSSPGWDQHYPGVSPSVHFNPSVHLDPYSQHSAWNSPGTSHFHPEVGMSTVYHDRRHSSTELPIVGSHQWFNEVDDIEARARVTRETFQRRNSTGGLPYYSTPETSQYLPPGPPLQSSTPSQPCFSGAPYSMMYSAMQR